jgi:hypothetical protein
MIYNVIWVTGINEGEWATLRGGPMVCLSDEDSQSRTISVSNFGDD